MAAGPALAAGAATVAALGLGFAAAGWRPAVAVPGIVDVAGPRADGRLVLSSHAGLFLLRRGGAPEPFAAAGYAGAAGEPYLALIPRRTKTAGGCSFARDDVYVLDPDSSPGVVRVAAGRRVTRLVDLPAGVFPSGIAYDATGRFGHRLLVTGVVGDTTTLYAVDCTGAIATVTTGAPHVEGGIVVAPRRFGHFGGDLIGADESTGAIYAFGPGGAVARVADSGIPAGGDIGVEALGFVPRLAAGGAAYLADLGSPGSPTPGTDSLLSLARADLVRSGVRAGDLLAVAEGGAVTIDVRCGRPCTVRTVVAAESTTHAEGHVVFAGLARTPAR